MFPPALGFISGACIFYVHHSVSSCEHSLFERLWADEIRALETLHCWASNAESPFAHCRCLTRAPHHLLCNVHIRLYWLLPGLVTSNILRILGLLFYRRKSEAQRYWNPLRSRSSSLTLLFKLSAAARLALQCWPLLGFVLIYFWLFVWFCNLILHSSSY